MRTLLWTAMLLVALMLSASADAQTYFKWTDDQGTVHFTAEPPQDRAYERIDTSGNVIGHSDAEAVNPNDSNSDQRQNDAVQMPRQGEPDPEEVAARCAQARENLFWLENRRRIAVENPDGTEELVEGDARIEMVGETQAFIDEWCQGG
ncbi:MAG: DUF4124 domain-containing protein [Pseudomonadota bacterium]